MQNVVRNACPPGPTEGQRLKRPGTGQSFAGDYSTKRGARMITIRRVYVPDLDRAAAALARLLAARPQSRQVQEAGPVD